MKTLYLFMALLCVTVSVAQSEEFEGENGLIYSDKAIKKLSHIVDSLNLKFKVCEAKTFYSPLQGNASYINISGEKAAKAKTDIDNGVDFAVIKQKYFDEAEVIEKVLVVRNTYKDYENKDVLYFDVLGSEMQDRNGYDDFYYRGDNFKKYKDKNQGWLYTYYEKSKYSEGGIAAIYIKSPLKKTVLVDKYARIVQYSECLVDTTATVYFKDAERSYYGSVEGIVAEFTEYLHEKLKTPTYNYEELYTAQTDTIAMDTITLAAKEREFDEYIELMEIWESKRLSKVDSLMQHDKKCKQLFDKALKSALSGKDVSNDEFEEYVGIYSSKKNELFLKRSRIVVGGCSMDDSPRIHALSIAELAGETASWEIFLRSHLDIMNDRFERVSDGSYAWGRRKTYIKELEVLNINVSDLLLGIVLRVDNPSENHYFGNVRRIGRSLSESKDRDIIESEMLSMIKSKELDDYNRLLVYYLFLNYNYYLDNEVEKDDNKAKLKEAVAYLPKYIQPKDELN
ncbi:hypothetical protein GCM10007424_28310 [Flavobacterium suaedae]|uniref:Uncharacterized protein n=1 Tax=Flavobacterium suaedae TaxID=1767027 RepID=A0ABQ1K4X0_9FLAO|nr:hypothetical protein [Flavobacterium suaedae]GGB86560.1 hypothetical protein GCM10007424_28310 [Flavobacterium suaedae]